MERNRIATKMACFLAKAAVGTLVLLALSLTGGCATVERVAHLEGEVAGLKTVTGENRRLAQDAMAAAKTAQGTASTAIAETRQGREEAAQALDEARQGRNEAAQANSAVAGLQTVTNKLSTGLAAEKEYREKTVVPTLKRVEDHGRKIRALGGDEPAATPDTSALVAGPGAPAPKALAKQEGPITLLNPTVSQLKRAIEDDEREQKEVRLYGPTDAARQALYDAFRPVGKAGGLASSIAIRSLNTVRVGVEVDFGPLPDTVKATRKAPTP